MIDHGAFFLYEPADPVFGSDAAYFRNEAGEDFYSIVFDIELISGDGGAETLSASARDICGFLVDPETNMVVAAAYPADGLAPAGWRFIEAAPTPENVSLVEGFQPETMILSADGVGPRPITLDERRARAKEELATMVAGLGALAASGVPAIERDGWAVKEADARTVIEGGESNMLAAEAAITGETVMELATAVIARGAIYRGLVGAVSGIRRKASMEIDAAANADSVTAALTNARAMVDAAIAEFQSGEEN